MYLFVYTSAEAQAPLVTMIGVDWFTGHECGEMTSSKVSAEGDVRARVNSNAIEAIEAIEAIHLQLTTLSKLSTTNEAMPLHRYRRYRRYRR